MKSILKMLALMLTASAVFHIPALAQPPASILGKTDLAGLVKAAPGVPATAKDAAAQNHDAVYDPFYKRVNDAHAALKTLTDMRAKTMPQPDQASYEKKMKAQVESNPLISGMGGMEKMQQMTPEERKAAALKSAAAMQQNIITGNGRNSPEMQAMMQRVMTDPAYRARLNSMSEEQQRQEIARNMGTVAPRTGVDHEKAQQEMRAGQEAATANAVRNEIGEMAKQLGQIELEFSRRDRAVSTTPGNFDDIAREFGAKIAKIPMVALSEYGPERDPAQLVPLEREWAKRNRDRAIAELAERARLFADRQAQYNTLAANYQTWLKQNRGRINTSMGDGYTNNNSELTVAGYEDELISATERLAKYSDRISTEVARYENDYQSKLSGSAPTTTVARAKKAK